MRLKFHALLCVLIAGPLLSGVCFSQSSIPSPQETFGFRMGTDRMLIDWNQIVSYFNMVGERSKRVVVTEIGTTTLGKPFLLAAVSSEETIADLDRYKSIQQQIANPYVLDSIGAQQLIAEGKTVVLITLNIHSTEIASSQESVELLYELATAGDSRTREILDNVIVLIIPSLNPDGQQLVTDWYKKTVGTPAEGSSPPELYHYYAGHDNNRDWFMYNLRESRNTAKVLYHDWFPEIVYDQHQMGSRGPRLFLPPYADPVNPHVDPRTTSLINLLGNYVVSELHRQGKKGVVTGTVFNAYFEGTMSKTPLWHNRIGILSEAASAYIATPIFFPKGSIGGLGDELPENKTQTNFLDPWDGGWWHLRDIIEYEKSTTYSLLEFAARFKRVVKETYYTLNRQAILNGQSKAPLAYILPLNQHDPNAASDLVNRLMISGVTAARTLDSVVVKGRPVPAGSFLLSLAQPARAYLLDIMEPQRYPELLRYPGGPPRLPYDVTAWTLPLQMGVKAIRVEEPLPVRAEPIEKAAIPLTDLREGYKGYYMIERRFGRSYGVVNDLLSEKVPIQEVGAVAQEAAPSIPRGAFLISAAEADRSKLTETMRRWNVPVEEVDVPTGTELRRLLPGRIGIYQPWITSADEGWTRYVLDSLHFSYAVLHNQDFRKTNADLRARFDMIILPDMGTDRIVEGRSRPRQRDSEDEPVLGTPERPAEYQGGIGKEGVTALRTFVENGGTLLTFSGASDFAIEKLRVPAVNVLKGVTSKEFFAPGSMFEVNLDVTNPLAYGMTEKAVVYFASDPAFMLLPYVRESRVIASYGETNPLRSGLLIGEDRLTERTAMVEIPVGKGRIVMYGFRVQHRAQMQGTFKLFLNALYRSGD